METVFVRIVLHFFLVDTDLAVLNIVAVIALFRVYKIQSPFSKTFFDQTFSTGLIRAGTGIGFIIFLLAGIAIRIHDGLPGQQQRFEFTTEQPN